MALTVPLLTGRGDCAYTPRSRRRGSHSRRWPRRKAPAPDLRGAGETMSTTDRRGRPATRAGRPFWPARKAGHHPPPPRQQGCLESQPDPGALQGAFDRRAGSQRGPLVAIAASIEATAPPGIARRGACPSPTTPSPVVLAEVPSRAPSRAGCGAERRGSDPGPRRSPIACSTVSERSPRLGRGSFCRSAPVGVSSYNPRGAIPSLFEEMVQ
jgi:hypothetical protein